jgi:hypothetical protein
MALTADNPSQKLVGEVRTDRRVTLCGLELAWDSYSVLGTPTVCSSWAMRRDTHWQVAAITGYVQPRRRFVLLQALQQAACTIRGLAQTLATGA